MRRFPETKMTRRRPNGYFGSRVGSLLSSYRQLLSNLSLAVAQDVAVMWVGIPQMECYLNRWWCSRRGISIFFLIQIAHKARNACAFFGPVSTMYAISLDKTSLCLATFRLFFDQDLVVILWNLMIRRQYMQPTDTAMLHLSSHLCQRLR